MVRGERGVGTFGTKGASECSRRKIALDCLWCSGGYRHFVVLEAEFGSVVCGCELESMLVAVELRKDMEPGLELLRGITLVRVYESWERW